MADVINDYRRKRMREYLILRRLRIGDTADQHGSTSPQQAMAMQRRAIEGVTKTINALKRQCRSWKPE